MKKICLKILFPLESPSIFRPDPQMVFLQNKKIPFAENFSTSGHPPTSRCDSPHFIYQTIDTHETPKKALYSSISIPSRTDSTARFKRVSSHIPSIRGKQILGCNGGCFLGSTVTMKGADLVRCSSEVYLIEINGIQYFRK